MSLTVIPRALGLRHGATQVEGPCCDLKNRKKGLVVAQIEETRTSQTQTSCGLFTNCLENGSPINLQAWKSQFYHIHPHSSYLETVFSKGVILEEVGVLVKACCWIQLFCFLRDLPSVPKTC